MVGIQEKPSELDMRVFKELARLGYTPATLHQSFQSLQTLHEFVQFAGTHQYYSDAVNRRIFLLSLDIDFAIITAEELMLGEKNFVDEVQKALVLKAKHKVEKKKLDEFKAKVGKLEERVFELASSSKELISRIRDESRSRDAL